METEAYFISVFRKFGSFLRPKAISIHTFTLCFNKIHFNIVFQLCLSLPSGIFSFQIFWPQIYVRFSTPRFVLHVPLHPILFESTTLVTLNEESGLLSRYSDGLRAGRTRNLCSISGRDMLMFSSPQWRDRLWCPSSLLSNGYGGFFSRSKTAGDLNMITHLHLVFMALWLIK
jgi:hypothetical protein